jgi:hypothetical protein
VPDIVIKTRNYSANKDDAIRDRSPTVTEHLLQHLRTESMTMRKNQTSVDVAELARHLPDNAEVVQVCI